MQTTIALGIAMAAIAVINASLMAWLWRFPMRPDPTGRDPHGVSTAPRFGVNLHRALGYAFVLVYVALLVEMLPRAWEFRVWTGVGLVHGLLGVLLGLVLFAKIAVIRRFRQFGHRLPWIGGVLAAVTLAVASLGVVPAWIVVRPLTPLPADLDRGRYVVARKCNQCHGASVIAGEREDRRKWERLTREMQQFSREMPGKEPITDEERILAAAYLAHVRGEEDDEEDEDEREEGRRGRSRQRGRG